MSECFCWEYYKPDLKSNDPSVKNQRQPAAVEVDTAPSRKLLQPDLCHYFKVYIDIQ